VTQTHTHPIKLKAQTSTVTKASAPTFRRTFPEGCSRNPDVAENPKVGKSEIG